MGIVIWMAFEAIAPDRSSAESLDDHIEALESEDGVEILESEVDEVSEIEDPHPDLEKGYSKVSEMRIEIDNFSKAMEIVINYGPTYVQLEGPENIEMSLAEAQDALQKVVNTVHQYAQSGLGGVLISSEND